MKIYDIYISSCSAAFEFDNDLCYENAEEYTVYVNGKPSESFRENVFSLFDLSPDTNYSVYTSLEQQPLTFRTKPESCCINVRDFGAQGDGLHDDTKAIQTAIVACPEGGRIRIPEGTYLVTPVTLKSHITIEIMEGAVLLGSTDEREYAILPGEVKSADGTVLECASWEGYPAASHQSLLSAYHAEDIHIVGKGTIDGNAQNSTWWIDAKNRAVARPKLLFTNRCRDIHVHGLHFQNSPSWHLHPYQSKRIGIYHIRVTAPKDSPNTDGCNPESCDSVEIIGSRFSVGDDAIAIKSGKLYEGKKVNVPASRHTIRNCLMEFAHGAVVLGSE
ncbi:MAG: glycoside hydrolase family 28 protein, partial [Bacillota bacterium]